MNCYYHNDKEVVAACIECGRLICDECKVNINGKAVCKTCIETGVLEQKGGYKYNRYNYNMSNSTQKSWLVTLLLCLFTGTLGVHRFYVGKIGTGILQFIPFSSPFYY